MNIRFTKQQVLIIHCQRVGNILQYIFIIKITYPQMLKLPFNIGKSLD